MNPSNIVRGPLIVVEGIDGAGKSSVVRALVSSLEEAGYIVTASREPTTGPWGQKVRESYATERMPVEQEAECLLRDRQEHVRDLVEPELAAGHAVVLDRYFPSMVAYQGARGMPIEDLLTANEFAPRPTALLILDLPAEVALARIRSRGAPNSFEKLENLRACRRIFQGFSGIGTAFINATQPPEEVAAAAVRAMWRMVPRLDG